MIFFFLQDYLYMHWIWLLELCSSTDVFDGDIFDLDCIVGNMIWYLSNVFPE